MKRRGSVKIKFQTNGKDLLRKIQAAINAFSDLTDIMTEVGQELKKEVLDSNNWSSNYDLRDFGQLLGYLHSEEPGLSGQGSVVAVGVGKISNLNKIYRPARTVNDLHIGPGDFPYWLVQEYGMIGRVNKEADVAPHGRKFRVNPNYTPLFIGYNPSGKPTFIMIRHENTTTPHAGIRPSRLFRNGLYKIISNQVIEKKMEQKFIRAVS